MGDSDIISVLLLVAIILFVIFFVLYYTCQLKNTPKWLVNVFTAINTKWSCESDEARKKHLVWENFRNTCSRRDAPSCAKGEWPLEATVEGPTPSSYCCSIPFDTDGKERPKISACSTDSPCKENAISINDGSGGLTQEYCCGKIENMISDESTAPGAAGGNIYWWGPLECEMKGQCSSSEWALDASLESGKNTSYCCSIPEAVPHTCATDTHSLCPKAMPLLASNTLYCCDDAT